MSAGWSAEESGGGGSRGQWGVTVVRTLEMGWPEAAQTDSWYVLEEELDLICQ